MIDEYLKNDVTKEDFKNDWELIRCICDDKITLNEKEQIIKENEDRINNFNDIQTIYFLTSISLELCEKCEEFIKNRIETLNKEVLAKIFSQDGKGIVLTNIANYLVKQDWFNYKEEYQKYIIAYNLIKDNNSENNDKVISYEEIYEYGEYILNMLNESICDVDIMNIILKNYLELVKKHYPNYFNFFMARGYVIIDKYMADNTMLTRNMMIFDCFITSYLYDIKDFSDVKFYVDDDGTNAYYNSGTLCINMRSVYKLYDMKKVTTPSLYLLYILSHEMVHASQHDYTCGLKPVIDNHSKLRLHNLFTSLYLSRGIRELYNEKHDSFYHEYDALVRGLDILYEKCKLFPSYQNLRIEKFNKMMANRLLDSYCYSIDSDVKLSPTQFVIDNFNLYKDKIFYKSTEKVISASEIDKIESNLTDYEKFILGYDNPYLEVIKNIADGNPYFSSTNLTLDIPKFYEQYGGLFSKKYEFYNDKSEVTYKVKVLD